MAVTISSADIDFLCQEENPHCQDMGHKGFSDIVEIIPKSLGQGYVRSMTWDGINLALYRYHLYEDLHVICEASDASLSPYIGEIGFNLSGNLGRMCTGDSFILWGCQNNSDKYTNVLYANDPTLKVDIHVKPSSGLGRIIRDSFDDLPPEISQCLDEHEKSELFRVNRITPAMRVSLEQIFQCPFQGRTKQIYLESKCLELVAFKLEQLKDIDKRVGPACSLKPDDIDRIHLAKEILTRNLSDPPSLMELARKVNLNDYKLKIGFRQVFDTTVLNCLYQHRMEMARHLLAAQEMSVKEVARAVGYVNQSKFAVAFRKQFGVNPKVYLLSKGHE